MSNLYHCCSLPLAAGSVVEPGNWGRIIKLYTPQTSPNSWIFVRELIFEQVRKEFFADKPSRLESIFLCPDLESIQKFKNGNSRNLDLVYEVEVLDVSAARHTGDWTLCSINNNYNHAIFTNIAKQYWTGNNIANPELFTTSPIKIVRQIS